MPIKAVDRVCESCQGSGLYVGFAERRGGAVVCSSCKGEGHYEETFRWTEWKEGQKRVVKRDIKRVFATNPGIGIGEGELESTGQILKLEDFGGVDYKEWQKSGKKAFVKGTEMRKFTCPAWWWQSANYDKKPDWKECCGFGSFSNCKHFCKKEKCWERYDKFGKRGK